MESLTMESLSELDTYMPLLQKLIWAVIIFVLGWTLSKWAQRLTLRAFRMRSLDELLGRFLSTLAQYTVLLAAFIAALGAVGVQTTSLVAVMASAGLAVGLALQGSLSHFASGVMLLIFRPFTLGDVVELAGFTGKVDDIGIFATTLVTFDNKKVILPNAKVVGDSICNITAIGTRRGAIDVGVAYGADIGKVSEILKGAADSVACVLDDPEAKAVFQGFGDSALNFTVFSWCGNDDYLQMLVETRTAIYDRLNAAGIDIPFNQIVVHQTA